MDDARDFSSLIIVAGAVNQVSWSPKEERTMTGEEPD
jgi:hypothetical protein